MATITITLLAGAGTPPLDFQVGDQVGLEATGGAGGGLSTPTYLWTFVDKPAASAAVLNNATSQNADFTVDVEGTYLVQVVVDGYDMTRAAAGCPLVVIGPSVLRPPAIGEMVEANMVTGWGREFQNLFYLMGTVSSILSSLFASGRSPGDPPVYFVDSVGGDDVTGDGSFALPWQTVGYAVSQCPVAPADTRAILCLFSGTHDLGSGVGFSDQAISFVGLGGSRNDVRMEATSIPGGNAITLSGETWPDGSVMFYNLTIENLTTGGNESAVFFDAAYRTTNPAFFVDCMLRGDYAFNTNMGVGAPGSREGYFIFSGCTTSRIRFYRDPACAFSSVFVGLLINCLGLSSLIVDDQPSYVGGQRQIYLSGSAFQEVEETPQNLTPIVSVLVGQNARTHRMTQPGGSGVQTFTTGLEPVQLGAGEICPIIGVGGGAVDIAAMPVPRHFGDRIILLATGDYDHRVRLTNLTTDVTLEGWEPWQGYDNAMICFEWMPTDLLGAGVWREMWRKTGFGRVGTVGFHLLGSCDVDLKAVTAGNLVLEIPETISNVMLCAMMLIYDADAPNGDAIVQCGVSGGVGTELFGPTTLVGVVDGDVWFWDLYPAGMVPAGGGILPADVGIFKGPKVLTMDVTQADTGGITMRGLLMLFGMNLWGA
jgi:hypothetical protein